MPDADLKPGQPRLLTVDHELVGADDVAAVVARAATTTRPATRYRVGAMSRGLVLGRRVTPDRLWDAAMTRQFRDPGTPVRA